MKKLVLFIATALYLTSSHAQTAEEKAYMAYMTPGKEHEMLAKSVGKWNEELTFYMDPKSEPMKAQASLVVEMILGGRYQKGTSTGEMMGMPFEGISTMAFDNMRKVWIMTWTDNMGTGIAYAEGTYDAAKKMLSFKGKMPEPSSGTIMDFRQTFTMVDDDHQKIEMYNMAKGKESKTMEITLTRVK
jgi:hypothetical protein